MIVKEVLEEELLTLAEVREMLHTLMEQRLANEEDDLEYSFKKALIHTDKFSKISGSKSRELVNKLLEMGKMTPFIAVQIADILPESRDEVRSIYAKQKYTLEKEELDAILDTVSEFNV